MAPHAKAKLSVLKLLTSAIFLYGVPKTNAELHVELYHGCSVDEIDILSPGFDYQLDPLLTW
jgi:hypothetical protein